jgi:hypothetical protein
VGLALDVVIEALRAGDQRLALTILKTAGSHLAERSSRSEPKSDTGVVLLLAQQREDEATRQLFVSQSYVSAVERESNFRSDLFDD